MEICFLRNPPFPQPLSQFRKEAVQEPSVLTHRRGMPSEDLLLFSVYRRHHLRSIFCTPLREQMGHLIIFNPTGSAQINPAFQPVESKPVFSVLYFHFDQLCRSSLHPHRRIQRRRKERNQHHVTSSQHVFMEIILQKFPVFF